MLIIYEYMYGTICSSAGGDYKTYNYGVYTMVNW